MKSTELTITETVRGMHCTDPADLEEAFAEAIGPEVYQKLLKEKWLPFQGVAHLRLGKEEAVSREAVAAREFLASLETND